MFLYFIDPYHYLETLNSHQVFIPYVSVINILTQLAMGTFLKTESSKLFGETRKNVKQVKSGTEGHRLRTIVGIMWRELARQMINTYLAACVHKTKTKKKYPSRMAANCFFFREDTVRRCRPALGSSTMDPPDIFEAVINTCCPCPTPNGFAVGRVHVHIERRSSHELTFINALTIFN